MKIKKEIFTMFALFAFVSMVVSCGSGNNNISDLPVQTGDEIVRKDSVFTGQELFRRNCAGCHGLNKEGTPPVFPSLVTIKDKMNKEQIHDQIKNGKGLMISHAHLPDNEISAIIAYLFNEPDAQTVIKNYSSVDLGRTIVMSNCVSCHRLTVNDSLPPNVKVLCPLIEPSALIGEVNPLTLEEFYLVLKTGPCSMPSFNYLTPKDKEAIWTYLKNLERQIQKFQ
ncbi:MAG: c-type cytochrome [Bacteroidota bacterium]